MNKIRESRQKKEARKNGGTSRMAMGFAMVVIALVLIAVLLFFI